MHIPKEAIEKAIEGGWCKNYGNGKPPFKHGVGRDAVTILYNEGGPIQTYYYAQIALDPTFWQALGKSCGWDKNASVYSHTTMTQWQQAAMQFYDLILTGGDTEKFWAEILK